KETEHTGDEAVPVDSADVEFDGTSAQQQSDTPSTPATEVQDSGVTTSGSEVATHAQASATDSSQAAIADHETSVRNQDDVEPSTSPLPSSKPSDADDGSKEDAVTASQVEDGVEVEGDASTVAGTHAVDAQDADVRADTNADSSDPADGAHPAADSNGQESDEVSTEITGPSSVATPDADIDAPAAGDATTDEQRTEVASD